MCAIPHSQMLALQIRGPGGQELEAYETIPNRAGRNVQGLGFGHGEFGRRSASSWHRVAPV